MKPSSSSSPTPFELTYTDDGGKYAFNGNRSTKENQYVLIFDPERKAFVLHRVDSTFNMNLVRTPATSDAEALKDEYPHLDTSTRGPSSSQAEKKKAGTAKGAGKGKKGSAGMFMENKKTAPKPSKSAAANNSSSSNKEAAASAAAEKKEKEAAEKDKDNKKQKQPPQRTRSPVGSEEEDSDDDGGLLVEYPDPVDTGPVAVAPVRSRESPFPTAIRRFSEFVSNQAEESDEDADAEYEEEDYLIEEGGDSSEDRAWKLPSPVGRSSGNNNNMQGGGAGGGGEEVDDDTPEDAELMAMLEEEIGGGMDVDSESSVSEED